MLNMRFELHKRSKILIDENLQKFTTPSAKRKVVNSMTRTSNYLIWSNREVISHGSLKKESY